MLRLIVDEDKTLKEFTDENYAQGSFYFSALFPIFSETKNQECIPDTQIKEDNVDFQNGLTAV